MKNKDRPPPRPDAAHGPASQTPGGASTRSPTTAEPGAGRGGVSASPQGQAERPSLLPALTLPKGGGAIRGIGEKFSVNAATGTSSLTVPLPVSPGRNGFGPQIDLAYDSGHGNGPFGLGFALSVPTITRKTDKGLPRYYDQEESDEFILSGAEDLVPLPSAPGGAPTIRRYRPRVEGLFARIERHIHSDGTSHWQVTTKDNVTHSYGTTAAAQIVDPKNANRVFSWLLEESRDDRGNVVRYEYKAEDGAGVVATLSERSRFDRSTGSPVFAAGAQRYVKRVRYANATPQQASDFLFELVFDYGEHPGDSATPTETQPWPVRVDPFSSYKAGFEVRTYRLCQRVLMFHRTNAGRTPVLVRSTNLSYQPGPAFTYLTGITQWGYIWSDAGALVQKRQMPTLALTFAEPVIHDQPATLPADSLDGLAGGVDGGRRQWIDLDGEGIPGVLIDDERAWYYKANAGEGQLAPPRVLASLPSPASLAGGLQQLQDLAGDGQLDLVAYQSPLSGYATRTPDGDFEPLRPFLNLPNIDWHDPNLQIVDLDGDGLADLLLSEDDAFLWYRSQAKAGFTPAERVFHPGDEDKGAAVIFADGTETIHLSDMSGDGLVDIVRVRNGEVCYWPNLGYGRFGAKVTLENSPRFAGNDDYDPRRIRFGDVDGSGTSDIFYLGVDGVRIYLNQSGNRLGDAITITSLPPATSTGQIGIVDLLGQGTACLVWSSPLPGDAGQPLRYVDLMAGSKPHLLKSVVNNLGAETQITYAASTKFYLADKAAGQPWLTRLAFPVHVVERIDRRDAVSKSHLVTTYRYSHGFFDGVEREFRGFARVEQRDAEDFTVGIDDPATYQAPTRLVSWFHTGAWLEKERLESGLAKEYHQDLAASLLLPDTLLLDASDAPATSLSIQDQREAARALRGHLLHQELFADDGKPEASKPYSVTEQSYAVRLVQSSQGARHGVFLVLPRETVTIHTERNPTDPRVTHELVLDVDQFGNVTRQADVAYGRANIAGSDARQRQPWATLTTRSFINHDAVDFYRLGLPAEESSYELVDLPLPAAGQGRVGWQVLKDAVEAIDAAHSFAYDQTPTGSGPKRRMLDRKQQLYYDEALAAPAALGQTGSRGLPYETYQLALTAGLVAELVSQSETLSGTPFDPALLLGEGHYVQRPGDTGYWTRSGQIIFAPGQFCLPVELVDPFGKHYFVTWDDFRLLVTVTRDPLGNIVQADNDYRVLAPWQVTDPNLNRVAVAFDALGMVVKTVVMGKAGSNDGDTFEQPGSVLEYDLLRWPTQGLPAVVHTMARERHRQDAPVQHSYTYCDGFGRIVMQKVQAEPAPGTTTPRWVGTGRTVFNNKGNPVKQYEPFFSATSEFEDEAAIVEGGVTPILHYDPLDRVIRTELPNRTESRVDFGTWTQTSHDPNDTVTETEWYSSRKSPDPSGPEPSDVQQRAAWLAARHANTPTVTHLDALGRAFLVVETCRTYANGGTPTEEPLRTRTVLDIEGNALAIIDARQATLNVSDPLPAQRQRFDVLSRVLRTDSIDAGTRLMVADIGHKPLRAWDSRGQTQRADFDDLQRPLRAYVQKDAIEKVVTRMVYGESLDPAGPMPTDPTAPSPAQQQNLRGQPYLIFDGAGLLKNHVHDFKGNLLQSSRRLASAYKATPEWTALPEGTPAQIEAAAPLEAEVFTASTTYDALNRVVTHTTPDTSVATPAYNEAGLLESLQVSVRGAPAGTVIANLDYNAKGQRVLCEYADPTASTETVTCRTEYAYDPLTFRLTNLVTNRLAGPTVTAAKLQDLRYTYDPVGNIVQLDDRADTAPIFSGTTPVSGDARYRYDSLYRLVQAEGREHPGQTQPGDGDIEVGQLPHPNDLQALIRYLERYTYDQVGNLTKVAHTAAPSGQWTRNYNYATDSNRLLGTSLPGDPDGTYSAAYTHDAHGSMTHMLHLPVIDWDHADRMQHANRVGGGDVYFAYDAAGQRVRKVYEHTGVVEERIYLGGYELYRKRSGSTLEVERQTLHVMDDQNRVAMVETKAIDVEQGPGPTRWRFQHANHLGSATLELAETGKVITYEEYHPYGTTAFRSSTAEVSAKRYRYTGKEKDEETGLYHHGARYYAPWLGRWTAADPAGFVDGINLFEFTSGNPVCFFDPTGFGREEQQLGNRLEQTMKEHQALANERRAQKGLADVKVDYQKREGGVVPDEVRTTPGTAQGPGHKQVVELKARHVKSARNRSASARKADLIAGFKQVYKQLLALRKAGKIDANTRGRLLRVIYDNERGASARKALPRWRNEAEQALKQWIKTARTMAQRTNRSLVSASTTTADAIAQSKRSIQANLTRATGTTVKAVANPLAIVEAGLTARDLKIASQGMERTGPAILEDSGGEYTVSTREGILLNDYFKTYVSGPKAGETTELGFFQMLREVQKRDEKYGGFDWKGDFVPGRIPPLRQGWEPPPEPFM